jgi:pimeloyl-ACP methyl ester carboxylesterase
MTTENKVILRHYKLIMTQPNISTQQLKKIKCPTLVVAGDHDAVKVQHTALIAQSIPNSNLWIAPNAGHGLMVFQYKDKFNTEVEDFFNRKFKKIQGYDMFKN